MEDHDSPEAVKRRALQEDPIAMYLIVRESINMSIGKTAAQCAHSSQMLQMKYEEVKDASRDLQRQIAQLVENDKAGMLAEYKAMAPSISIYGEWMRGSFRKVVLRADEKEWQRLKEEIKDQPHVIVRDAGLTELTPGTETVIGLWPARKSNASKTVKRLQVLK
jgi:peptidyl-tRNA hydrolase, PTH2 family